MCLFACPRVGGHSNMIITYRALDITVQGPKPPPSRTYSSFPTKCLGDDISLSLPYANESCGKARFSGMCVCLSVHTNGIPFHLYPWYKGPPGACSNLFNLDINVQNPPSWPDIWWILKHVGLASRVVCILLECFLVSLVGVCVRRIFAAMYQETYLIDWNIKQLRWKNFETSSNEVV